ncbi:unnamed protein product [Heterobilharzia americana]|nr:unnamed protein product [Heterobilharzia americana]
MELYVAGVTSDYFNDILKEEEGTIVLHSHLPGCFLNLSIKQSLSYQYMLSASTENEVTMASSFGLISHGLISPDSERHRRIALKALNERFMKSEGSASATSELPVWPNLVGSDETQKLEKGEPKESSVVIQLPTDVNSPKSSFTDSSSVCNPSTTGILSE